MAVDKNEIESVLRASFPDSEIVLEDLLNDQDHYSLVIKDTSFRDLSIINQHKLVKTALHDLLSSRLHAITIKTVAK